MSAGPYYCHFWCNALDDTCMLVQLQVASLSENKLEGSLPETWSNLSSVSLLQTVNALHGLQLNSLIAHVHML